MAHLPEDKRFSDLQVVPIPNRPQQDLEVVPTPISTPVESWLQPDSPEANGEKYEDAYHQPKRSIWKRGGLWATPLVILVVLIVVGGTVGGVLGGKKARGSSKVTSSGSANGASDGTSNGTSGSSSSSTSTAATMSGTATSRSDYSFPTPVSHGYPDLDILAIGSDKHVYHKYRDPSSLDDFGPSTLTREDLGDTNSTEFTTLAALWRSAADLDLFLVGGDKKMYHKYFSGSSWGPSAGFEPRDGISTTAPTAVAWDADTLDIFTLGEGSALYRQMWSRSDGWVDWNGLGGNWANYAPTVVSWAQGQLDVFVVSSVDHTLHHGFVTTNRTWQAPDGDPFDNLGGYLTGRPVAV